MFSCTVGSRKLLSGPVNRAAQNIFINLPLHFSSTTSPIVIMPSIPKTSRHEHLAETLAVIISLHEVGKLHAQIDDHLKLSKFTVTSIIHCCNSQPGHLLRPTKGLFGCTFSSSVSAPFGNLISLASVSTSASNRSRNENCMAVRVFVYVLKKTRLFIFTYLRSTTIFVYLNYQSEHPHNLQLMQV